MGLGSGEAKKRQKTKEAPDQPEPAEQDAQGGGPFITFTVILGKNHETVTIPEDVLVGKLKADIAERTSIAANTQKLLLKGKPLIDDSATLKSAGIKSGIKLMLIGTPAPLVEATRSRAPAAASSTAAAAEWDSQPEPSEPWSKQTPHSKILARGKPEDGVPGIAGRQVPLPEEVVEIRGLLNSQGTKVRAVFKPEVEELTLSSASNQQRIPYASVKKIETQTIEGQEEYSIVSLVLGSGRYWMYWWPSQYTASLKIRILGVASLVS